MVWNMKRGSVATKTKVKRGFFIVFEGLDGVGKSVQVAMLKDWLKRMKLRPFITKEPTENITGNILRIVLRMEKLSPLTDALLFAADRAEHIDKEIKKRLKKGQIVISERYVYANIAYQTVQGVSERFIKSINDFAIKPDLVILLDVPAETALRRDWNALYYLPTKFEKSMKFNDRVRKKYLEMAKKYDFVVIDANKSVDDVFEDVKNVVNKICFNKNSLSLSS
jgi:dTMP kinase